MDHIPISSSMTSIDSELNIFNEHIIDQFIEKETQEGFPGVALLIVRNGKILKYNEHGTVINEPQLLTLRSIGRSRWGRRGRGGGGGTPSRFSKN